MCDTFDVEVRGRELELVRGSQCPSFRPYRRSFYFTRDTPTIEGPVFDFLLPGHREASVSYYADRLGGQTGIWDFLS